MRSAGLVRLPYLFLLALPLALPSAAAAQGQPDPSMTFFITSAGKGQGANLGGLEGADKHCQDLAAEVGAGGRTWRAYLSAQARDGQAAVHARDRIGKGPWRNAKGVLIAADLAELHGPGNKIGKETGLTEKGVVVNGKGDSPNQHDILTGSHADGTAYGSDTDMTCQNWTGSTTGKAMLGHHDRHGVASNIDSNSWVESHASSGCSQSALIGTGGNGYFYCFAADGATGLGRKDAGPRPAARPAAAWNAFGRGSDIPLSLAAPAEVRLLVLDPSGGLLADIPFGRLPAGEHRLHWDGRDAAGRDLPRGFYPARLKIR